MQRGKVFYPVDLPIVFVMFQQCSSLATDEIDHSEIYIARNNEHELVIFIILTNILLHRTVIEQKYIFVHPNTEVHLLRYSVTKYGFAKQCDTSQYFIGKVLEGNDDEDMHG